MSTPLPGAIPSGAPLPPSCCTGDEDALVLEHLALADRIAAQYVGRGIDRDDLVQVARLGLVKAVRRYREGEGASFSAFAAPTISGELKRHFRDAGWGVRPPRRLQELGARLRWVEQELEQQLQRPPTRAEVAAAMQVRVTDIDESRRAAMGYRPQSLDAPAAGSPGTWAVWTRDLESEDGFVRLEQTEWLTDAVAQLGQRERLVLHLRFDEGLTQSQIGEQLGVSQMQVSRILRSVLSRLRSLLTETSGAVA